MAPPARPLIHRPTTEAGSFPRPPHEPESRRLVRLNFRQAEELLDWLEATGRRPRHLSLADGRPVVGR